MTNVTVLHNTVAADDNIIVFRSDLPESDKKALLSIERNITNRQNPPENSRVVTITPGMAEYLLRRYNHTNRPKKPIKIGLYASVMAADEWRLTGDTIKFSDHSLLVDGQNRLEACVASGKPFRTHVVFNVPHSFFSVMDQGKNRDGSDLLAIANVPNAKTVAGAVRWATLYDTDTVKQRTTFTPPEVLRLFNERHSGVANFAQVGRAVYNMHKWPAGFVAGTLYHLSKLDPVLAGEFGKAMATNTFSKRFASLETMKDALAILSAQTNNRVHDVSRAALMIMAWNLMRQGKKGRKSDLTSFDPQKSPFPVAI